MKRLTLLPTLPQGVQHLIFLLLLGATALLFLHTLAMAGLYACSVVGDADCPNLFTTLPPLIVALVFWAVSFITWLSERHFSSAFFLLLVAGILATGTLTTLTPGTEGRDTFFFYLQLAILPPVMYHLHQQLVRDPALPTPRWSHLVLYLLVAGAALWTALLVVGLLTDSRLFRAARLGSRLSLIFGLVCVGGLLWHRYHHLASRALQRRIRLISFGTLLAFAPLFVLSVLPDTLGLPYAIPYPSTFILMILSPLLYLYALTRPTSFRLNRAVREGLTLYLLLCVLLTFYWLVSTLSESGIVPLLDGFALFVALCLSSLLVAGLYAPSQRLARWLLHGREIDYQRLAEEFTATFVIVPQRETVEEQLLYRLPEKLRLPQVSLYIRNATRRMLIPVENQPDPSINTLPSLHLDGTLARYLAAHPMALHATALAERFADSDALSKEEQSVLALPNVAYWLPFVSQGVLHGFLLIGERRHEDSFTVDDLRFFQVIIHQMGIALHNLSLLEEVQASSAALDLAHRNLLLGVERERLRMAQELHDGPLQQLLKVAYQLGATAQAKPDAATPLLEERQGVLEVVKQVRYLLREVRPAGLYELGLEAALQDFISSLATGPWDNVPAISLSVERSLPPLPDELNVCLFRIIQEALQNVLKHAAASRALVLVRAQENGIFAMVQDNGKGFIVPKRMSQFVHQGHFGLQGATDRAAWVGGQVEVASHPNEGSVVTVWVPLPQNEREIE